MFLHIKQLPEKKAYSILEYIENKLENSPDNGNHDHADENVKADKSISWNLIHDCYCRGAHPGE